MDWTYNMIVLRGSIFLKESESEQEEGEGTCYDYPVQDMDQDVKP